MSYRFSFSGIDGSGKSTTIDEVSKTLASNGCKVIHASRPSWFDTEGEDRRYMATKINVFFDFLHGWADAHRYRSLVGIVNVGYCEVRRLIEKYGENKFKPNIVLVGRDSSLDPFAYSTYYFPFTRNLSSEMRMQIVSSLLCKPRSDKVFYFDVDPNIAYERILQRIDREKKYGAKNRAKWSHMHENPDDLKFLQEQFEISIELLVKEDGANIIRLDATKSQENVVQEILFNIGRVVNNTRQELLPKRETYLGIAKRIA